MIETEIAEELSIDGIRITHLGLDLPDDLSYPEWAAIGRKLRRAEQAIQWLIGDWVRYGERHFGEMHSQALDESPYAPGSVRNMVYVADKFEVSRRRETLPFGHHQVVASLPEEQADRLLDEAEEKGWTNRDLRAVVEQIREQDNGPKPIPDPRDPVHTRTYPPLLRFCPPEWTSAQIVTAILRVCFSDAHTALDLTYGNGAFWDGSAHVEVTGVDANPNRSPSAVADFRDLDCDDAYFDVCIFDPPHLADGGVDSVMTQRFGTYPADELVVAVRDGAREAWRCARLGIVVKVTDAVHGQEYVEMSEWVRDALQQPPYEIVHQVREHAMIDPKWGEQCSAYNNGATYLVFRKGDQRHVRRLAGV